MYQTKLGELARNEIATDGTEADDWASGEQFNLADDGQTMET
jgi:hypothetical protein